MKKLFVTAGLMLAAFAVSSAQAGDADKGKATFAKKGCWQCHGYEGQGGAAGARLANTQLPEASLIALVRGSVSGMPPFSEKLISDADLSDVFAFLQSRPKPADPATIPLLAQ